MLRRTTGSCRHAVSSVAPPREPRPATIPPSGAGDKRPRGTKPHSVHSLSRCVPGAGATGSAVVATIDAVVGAATLDRFPEATAQAACADRLVLTKSDLVSPSPSLLGRLAALNPGARIVDAASVVPATLLFGGLPSAGARPRFVATAIHAHGIRAVVLVLRRPVSRLDFSLALGGLARERGEDLLRVKG